MAGATSPPARCSLFVLSLPLLLLHWCWLCGAVETERTLAMIKPDGVSGNYTEKIKEAILESGFGIVEEAVVRLDAERASLFYAEHSGRSFFDNLVKYMTRVQAMLMGKMCCASAVIRCFGPDSGSLKGGYVAQFSLWFWKSLMPSHTGEF